jgi:hypothetical protein
VILEVVRTRPDATFVELRVVLKKRGFRYAFSATPGSAVNGQAITQPKMTLKIARCSSVLAKSMPRGTLSCNNMPLFGAAAWIGTIRQRDTPCIADPAKTDAQPCGTVSAESLETSALLSNVHIASISGSMLWPKFQPLAAVRSVTVSMGRNV